MVTIIQNFLGGDELAACRAELEGAGWVDGKTTAGKQSASVKANRQLPPDSRASREWSARILELLGQNLAFVSAALPDKILPPMFNRYGEGEHYGLHVDNSIRTGTNGAKLRSDLSATLFLSDPASYDGGELLIETSFGTPSVKLPAGSLVIYPASSRHRVAPVTRGERLAAIFWVQSMVRDDAARTMLRELDVTVQALTAEHGHTNRHVVTLTGMYHNLLRLWAEV
jgi:PKHD-type hydroxylase